VGAIAKALMIVMMRRLSEEFFELKRFEIRTAEIYVVYWRLRGLIDGVQDTKYAMQS